MTGARFTTVCLNGARFGACELNQVVMRGVEMVDTTIDGEIQSLVINGVDVAPLVEVELDRRHPDRPKFRPTTPEGFREAWDPTSGCGPRPWRGLAACPRRCRTSRSTVSGHSFRPCATSRSRLRRGSAGPSWAIPARGTRYPCRGTSSIPGRECRTIVTRARRSTRHSPCGWRRWAMMRRVVDGLTDERLDSRTEPLVGSGLAGRGRDLPRPRVPADRSQRGVVASPVRRARPGRPRGTRLTS